MNLKGHFLCARRAIPELLKKYAGAEQKLLDTVKAKYRAVVGEDPTGADFPWKPPGFWEALGTDFLKAAGALPGRSCSALASPLRGAQGATLTSPARPSEQRTAT